MFVHHKYNKIYQDEIISKSNYVIISYKPMIDQWIYNAYSHSTEGKGVELLADLMRKNLLFYCFGEEEIVGFYETNKFSSLDTAAKYAYSQRLPKRKNNNDGLPGEVLLDLLIQVYNPKAYKLAVRTIFRQNDNNEIKGFDLTYFSLEDGNITIWLGQSKLGDREYCKRGIDSDLIKKYTKQYLSEQLFFVCDKRMELTKEAKQILSAIDDINLLCIENPGINKTEKLFEYFSNNNVSIKIPCLLAYEKKDIYDNPLLIEEMIKKELSSIREYFQNKKYSFDGFEPEIVIYIFPIEDIQRLRDKEIGFYDGLH